MNSGIHLLPQREKTQIYDEFVWTHLLLPHDHCC